MKRFLYFYLLRSDPDSIRRVAPDHAAYWKGLSLAGYLGGPFADRTGGFITFEAPNLGDAQRFVRDDPFSQQSVTEQAWVHEWLVE